MTAIKLTVGLLRQLLNIHPDDREVIIDGLGIELKFIAGYEGELNDQDNHRKVFVLEVSDDLN